MQATVLIKGIVWFISAGLLVAFIIAESAKHITSRAPRVTLSASAIIGGVCTVLLLIAGGRALDATRQVCAQHKYWYVLRSD